MVVDVSHCGDRTHAGCLLKYPKARADHPRQLAGALVPTPMQTDEAIKKIGGKPAA